VHTPDHPNIVCQRIRLSGVVQGVGLRPLVLRLAKELRLTGWVRNDAQGVEIEICGLTENVDKLTQRLHKDAPPFARIDSITSRYTESVSVSEDFYILDSRGGRASTMIGQDTVVCRNCLGDMFDPKSRRWRYAFTNCVHCGPRYTICRGLPYDRARTSLKPFVMCNKCQTEYQRPEDHRLHAEGNCCPKCGPQIALLDTHGNAIAGDVIANAYELLRAGKVLAIKGPGGFHLACDAHNAAAVELIRERKDRHLKPFPVMLANAISATTYVQLSVGEPGLLNLPERPIILMITSGNPSREPPAIDNDEALQRLAGMADAFLVHDRDIVARCDDSIACSGLGGLQLIRRARGYAPRAIKLAHSGPSILAVGGPVRNAMCITRGDEAFVSQHIGELSNAAACAYFEEVTAHLLKMLEISPALVAHDLNRNTPTARFAAQFALQRGIPLLSVQHHHAHIASVLAEHHVTEPILALALDGGETGTDGKLWGGELLKVSGARFERLGHLAPIRLVGDDNESRAPWRLAASVLHELGRGDEIERRFAEQPEAARLAQQLSGDDAVQESTSLGRLIDAAAGLLGVNRISVYSGQPGLLLEGMAERFGAVEALSDGWKIEDGHLNLMPLFAALADEKHVERGAALFHATLVEALSEWLCSVAPANATVAAAGGCLQNQVLARGLRARLGDKGLRLTEARRVPSNDGGLALGQAWIAQQYLMTE